MIRRSALVAAAAVVLAACGDSGGSAATSGDPLPGADTEAKAEQRDGDRLPDVDIVGLSSGEASLLSDISGPAVVNLWATWCAPCRAEIPDFEEVHVERADEVRFVGINVGEDQSVAAEFIEEIGATYDQFSDLDGDVSTELRATSMPVTVVIDADGIVTTRHLGPLDQDGLNDAIDEALGLTES